MVKELMLVENPQIFGRRGHNPVYVSPYSYHKPSIRKRVHVPGYVKHLPGERNSGGIMRRNPKGGIGKGGIGAVTKEWFGGLDLMDMGAALGGLAAATMLPGMVIKTTETTGQKLLKTGVAFACAIGAGFVFRNVSPTAGKYAIAGGVAGALAQALGAFTGITIGRPSPRRIGTSTMVSPSFSREQESVQLITP